MHTQGEERVSGESEPKGMAFDWARWENITELLGSVNKRKVKRMKSKS